MFRDPCYLWSFPRPFHDLLLSAPYVSSHPAEAAKINLQIFQHPDGLKKVGRSSIRLLAFCTKLSLLQSGFSVPQETKRAEKEKPWNIKTEDFSNLINLGSHSVHILRECLRARERNIHFLETGKHRTVATYFEVDIGNSQSFRPKMARIQTKKMTGCNLEARLYSLKLFWPAPVSQGPKHMFMAALPASSSIIFQNHWKINQPATHQESTWMVMVMVMETSWNYREVVG